MKVVVCPEHQRPIIVTRRGRARVRCPQPDRCLDVYVQLPHCAMNGHADQFSFTAVTGDGQIKAFCSGCSSEFTLLPVAPDGSVPHSSGV